MNIHIKMEVRARELDGRLLLALVAAERGHRVLLGDLRALLSHRRWLPPGVFHDKSLTPSPRKLAQHRALVAAGFLVTSQDEEHGLIHEDYAEFAHMRFSDESLGQAAAAFAWGPHDAAGVRASFPSHADRVVVTGSPRVDLWRPELDAFHRSFALPGVDPERPMVLVASNAGVLAQNPFWVMIRNQRPNYFRGDEDPREFDLYTYLSDGVRYVGALVRALRRTARAHPDVQFVVRPHPVEDERAWGDLLGPVPNVLVTRHGSISRWIRAARLVVHNGSTSGIEAAVSGVPAVVFAPDGHSAGDVPNRLARTVTDADGLVAAVASAADPATRADWYGPAERRLLGERLAALDGPLAADRIVDAWERLDATGRDRPYRPRVRRVAAEAHRAVGRARAGLAGLAGRSGGGPVGDGAAGDRQPFVTAHKFAPFGRGEVEALAAALGRGLGRFDDVRVTRVGPRLVSLRRG